jgi:hypothetical protein
MCGALPAADIHARTARPQHSTHATAPGNSTTRDNTHTITATIYLQRIIYLHSRVKSETLQVTQAFYTRVTHTAGYFIL